MKDKVILIKVNTEMICVLLNNPIECLTDPKWNQFLCYISTWKLLWNHSQTYVDDPDHIFNYF